MKTQKRLMKEQKNNPPVANHPIVMAKKIDFLTLDLSFHVSLY
jgi:hypothetical protein